MPRTDLGSFSRPSFIVDLGAVVRDNGHQVDWANVDAAYINSATGKKQLPAGTAVGSAASNGKLRPRADGTNPAIGLLLTNAVEGETHAALSGYGVMIGGPVFENLLPDASGTPKVLDPDVKAELEASGTGWAFRQYVDSRAT